MITLWPTGQLVDWRGEDLVLREWSRDDADAMGLLFDTAAT